MEARWLGKPYYSLDAFCKNTYGEKYYKIALDAGLSCPNRDGTLSTGGCIFCSAGGSGDFAVRTDATSVKAQLLAGRRLFKEKNTGNRFIAYFQAYTNTYGPVSYLRDIYTAALSQPDVAGISIATRCDCLGKDVLALLAELKATYADKFIWVELGLQTIHETTSLFINSSFTLHDFEQAMTSLATLDIPVIVHVILGLPGETPNHMYETCRYLNQIPVADFSAASGSNGTRSHLMPQTLKPFGIKLQLLHVLKNTPLGEMYLSDTLPGFSVLSLEEYTDIVIHCLEILSPDITIHRLTGDGPKDLLIAPLFSLNKRNVLNTLHKTMRERGTYQGRCFYDAGSIDSV